MYTAESARDQITATTDREPKVAILMGTYNGERFLKEQLDSIAAQSHPNWELHVSDDGSTDNTLGILNTTTALWPNQKTTVRKGPRKGFVANFLSLACDPNIAADYYAFSDQDDVWENDKLERAIKWLQTIPADKPAMYCSRTRLIDESGKTLGFSPLFKRRPSFNNALVQSIAGANTMVFNDSARNLLIRGGSALSVVSHDWWVYMLVEGCGGEVIYDKESSILYRQHRTNLVGSNIGLKARWKRMTASLRGRFSEWNNMNLTALSKAWELLTIENRNTAKLFMEARSSTTADRVSKLLECGLYRQTLPGNLSLYLAAILGKI